MKKNVMILIGLILISVVLAFVAKGIFFQKSNLDHFMTLERLQQECLLVDSCIAEMDFPEAEWPQFVEEECATAAECPNVLEVSPTGNLYVNGSVIMQEVQVENVRKGSCAANRIWICSQGSTVRENGDGTYRLTGMDYALMQTDCRYLVFCTSSELNDCLEQKVYNLDDSLWFPYYNLTRDTENVLTEERYDPQVEFYTDSENVLGMLQELKQLVVSER